MVIMFAVVDTTNTVTGVAVENSLEEAQKANPDCLLVEMTTENSPATVGGYYDGSKFHERKDNA